MLPSRVKLTTLSDILLPYGTYQQARTRNKIKKSEKELQKFLQKKKYPHAYDPNAGFRIGVPFGMIRRLDHTRTREIFSSAD